MNLVLQQHFGCLKQTRERWQLVERERGGGKVTFEWDESELVRF